MNALRSWKHAGTLFGALALTTALFTSCEGLSIASPEGEVTLRVEGFVRDAITAAPIPNARVMVMVTFAYTDNELASVRTDAAGHYSLTYRLRHVVTDEEFEGDCYVWYRDTTVIVEIRAEAAGYRTWQLGFDAVPELRCTGELQFIEIRMRKQTLGSNLDRRATAQ